MKIKRLQILFIAIIIMGNLNAQESYKPWNNHKCAVVLTYDDGLDGHIDKVAPYLDSLGLNATFYLPGNAGTLNSRMNDWRKVAQEGHELGNHTLFHPCSKTPENREWVNDDYNLDNYSVNKIADELKLANTLLKAVDGKSERTHAYACGEFAVNDKSFIKLIEGDFVAARGVAPDLNTLEKADTYNLGSIFVFDQPVEELINIVKDAVEKQSLVIFLFHGVGGGHSINYSLEEHNKLARFLKENQKDIWVAPLVDVAKYMKEKRDN